ncbi:PIN domain-containing protein [Rhodobacteraceae bacterium 2376]|uniref:PIN domain-containing protein n=1 Tax=Rhabdonatronobacter sediminivivens TaxID=2743469 RepID=A0A7Z0HZ58_9RHOB|nr:PIN domain-containing protein [Rhabdonatronobacter sediminivivens]NYS24978.1 PIN domain-containing protein [Rhabdonatronobacter sediminivivens]
MSHPAPPVVLLDACVLFPSVLREILMDVAGNGGFTPLWSARILAEWQLAAARAGDDAAAVAQGKIARLRAAWPGAEVAADPELESRLDLPDRGDRHVLAAAITGGADRIVTLNLRDFPRRALAAESLRAQSPDDLLMELWLAHPGMVETAVARSIQTTEAASGRAQPLRPLLKRARLPRLGKALAQDSPS